MSLDLVLSTLDSRQKNKLEDHGSKSQNRPHRKRMKGRDERLLTIASIAAAVRVETSVNAERIATSISILRTGQESSLFRPSAG